MRIALGVEYNGFHFRGWQIQKGERTVQQLVQQALTRVAGQDIQVQCAGRTDSGVHALHQVVHFDTQVERPLKAWVLGSNPLLPEDVKIQWSRRVSDSFNARRSALSRHYRYVICNREQPCAYAYMQASWFRRPLDSDRMRQGAQFLLGEQDFTSFRGSGCQSRSSYRRMDRIEVARQGDFISVDVIANAFLLHMVRNIVGVLLKIGTGERPPHWAGEILAAKNRNHGAVTAPARGLTLFRVQYPDEYDIPMPEFQASDLR